MQKLKDKYKDYFKIGAEVNAWSINSHADLVTTHFNSITCENEMKPVSLAPEEGSLPLKGLMLFTILQLRTIWSSEVIPSYGITRLLTGSLMQRTGMSCWSA